MSKQGKTVLKKNKKLGTIWHPETGLVFRSKNDRVVIGQCVDDELVTLDEEMVETCKEWRFKYDESLLEAEEEEEEEVDEESAEEEAEEEDEAPEEEEAEEDEAPEEEEDEEEETPEETPEEVPEGGDMWKDLRTIQESLNRFTKAITQELAIKNGEIADLKKKLSSATKEAEVATKKMAQLKALFS